MWYSRLLEKNVELLMLGDRNWRYLISTIAIDLKPGSATKQFYGIKPAVVDESGKVLKGACKGRLCMTQSCRPNENEWRYKRFIIPIFQFDENIFSDDEETKMDIIGLQEEWMT